MFWVILLGCQEIKGQTVFYSQGFETANDWTLLPLVNNSGNYWVYETGSTSDITGSATHSGTKSLQIWKYNNTTWNNNYSNNATNQYDRTASKTFNFSTIPCGSSITFKYWVLCNGETGYDDLTVSVNSITVQGPMSGITTWQQKSIDLSAYVGNSNVTISFNWRNDDSNKNMPAARIDDIEISYNNSTLTTNYATICANTIQSLTALGSQNTIINQAFSIATFPANWTSIVGSGDAITINQSNNAGGTANEIKFTGNSITANIIDRVTYGPFNTIGQTSLSLSWKNYLWHYSSSYNYYIKVQTSTDNINWHDSGWVINPVTASMTSNTISTTLATIDIGSSTTYLSFTMGGQTFGAFYWNIDDVLLNGNQFPIWSPTTYLYTDPGATLSYTSNSQATTVYFKSPTSGSYPYTATINGCTTSTATITVNATNTASAASSSPTLCINSALTNITHTTTGATGIGTPTNLPSGITASWSSNTITISGTPTASGTFNYSIPLTGGCGNVNATGTIIVRALNTASAASSSPTLCINSALTNITHTTTGATGIGTPTNLPSGITALWSSNTITISGTPTASGTFNYTIPLTGGCGNVNATGTIIVNNVPAQPSNISGGASQCPNTISLTYSTVAVSGATNYTWSVPNGWIIGGGQGTTAITVTSGTSSQNGNISVYASNSCGIGLVKSYSVTVFPTLVAGSHNINAITKCDGYNPSALTFTTDPSGGNLPYTYQWQNNTINIPSETTNTFDPPNLIVGSYSYRCKITDGCGNIVYTTPKVINIVADPDAPSATKSPNTNSICEGTSLSLVNTTYGTQAGLSCGFEYQTSLDNGNNWTSSVPNCPTITATGTNVKIRIRVVSCGSGCNASSWSVYSWSVNPIIIPTFTPIAAVCSGATLAALPTTSTNSITGSWLPAINNTATTTYTFTPTPGLCATTKTLQITINQNPLTTPIYHQ